VLCICRLLTKSLLRESCKYLYSFADRKFAQLASSLAALAYHSGVFVPDKGKEGFQKMFGISREDAWVCASRHFVNTVRPQAVAPFCTRKIGGGKVDYLLVTGVRLDKDERGIRFASEIHL
jgi:hypothetical protein